jgi:hypothetical protein
MKFSFPARNLIQLKSIITRTNKHQSSRSVQDSFFLFFLSFFPIKQDIKDRIGKVIKSNILSSECKQNIEIIEALHASTCRLESGSESHCSKSFSTKAGFDLRAKGDTSGSCTSSASNDAASFTISMLIRTGPLVSLSSTIAKSRKPYNESKLEEVEFRDSMRF